MRKLMLSTLLVLGGVAGSPTPAEASCTIEAVESCDRDFGGSSNYYTIAIRGWCYLVRTAMCEAES